MSVQKRIIRVSLDEFWNEAWTNAEVAKEISVSANTISQYKNGNVTSPKIEVLLRFCEFFSKKYQKRVIVEDLLVFS